MCDLWRERFYGLLRGKEPLTSKVRSAVLDKTFFHRKVSFLVVFVQRIYQTDGKKGSRLQDEISWQFASDFLTTPDIYLTPAPHVAHCSLVDCPTQLLCVLGFSFVPWQSWQTTTGKSANCGPRYKYRECLCIHAKLSRKGTVQINGEKEFFWQRTNFEGFDMWL